MEATQTWEGDDRASHASRHSRTAFRTWDALVHALERP